MFASFIKDETVKFISIGEEKSVLLVISGVRLYVTNNRDYWLQEL
jgi:hypothetical protein